MKKLDVSPIATGIEFPVKKGTLQFLQDSYTEAILASIRNALGSSYSASAVYQLYGAVVAQPTSGNYTITAGSVFYNGEFFIVDAVSIPIAMATPGFAIDTTQYTTNADPVTFSDNNQRNVHNIRKIIMSDGGAISFPLVANPFQVLADTLSALSLTVSTFQTLISKYAIPTRSTIIVKGGVTYTTTFDKHRVNFSDLQDFGTGTVTFNLNFTGAIAGMKHVICFPVIQSSNTIAISSSTSFVYKMKNTGISTMVYGSISETACIIEFEYIGLDTYGLNHVLVSIYTNR